MYITGHAAVGIAMTAAAGVTNPVGAFAVGWLSHYVADFFPHGDEEVGDWCKRGKGLRRIVGVFLIDAAILATVSMGYIAVAGFSWWAFAAVVGSAIPDVLWGLEMVAKRRLFGWHERVHHANHNLFDVRMPAWAGLLLQTVAAGGIWYLVMTW